ncbi:hypothetical protein D3C78_601720 [compost metagenome]
MIRVLVIEDSENKLAGIRQHIESIGVHKDLIHEAKSINTALSELERTNFEVVIVDMALPQSDDDYEIDKKAGIAILECLAQAVSDRSLRIPDSLVVLTQYPELISKYAENLKNCRMYATLYEHASDDWKEEITNVVQNRIAIFDQKEPVAFDQNVVVTIHGIRTYGGWQNKIEQKFQNGYIVKSYGFNFHNAIDFFSEKSSKNEIKLFVDYLENLKKEYPIANLHIICHSFGTYITYHALCNMQSRLNIGSLILAGSILKPEQNINEVYKKHNIKRIVNDCSLIDIPLLLAQLISNRYSLAGIVGLKGDKGRINNRYFSGGHSLYFSDTHIDGWQSIIINDSSFKFSDKGCDNVLMDIYYGVIVNKFRFRLAITLLLSLLFLFYALITRP